MINKRFLLIFGITFLFSTVFLVAGEKYLSKQEIAMGTFVSITIEDTKNSESILDEAFTEIKRMEQLFSIYDKKSEISQLNTLKKLKVSSPTLSLLKKALDISDITGGAFDITCKPLLDLYKLAEKNNRPPTKKEIEDTLRYVGWKKIRIIGDIVELPENFEIDLGGIAKGYIVDKTADFLKERKIKNGIINAGGDIFAFGKNPQGKSWQIGIQDPYKKNKIMKRIKIENLGVATSGNYERFFSIRNKKYGHIVDPLTGKSVRNYPSSVTVIAKDCLTADAFTTAFFVLGEKKSIDLSNKLEGVETFIVGSNRRVHESKNFLRLFSP